jgi:hypothetical protein
MVILWQSARQITRAIATFTKLNAEQCYSWFLRFHHDFLARVPLRHIASFLGM